MKSFLIYLISKVSQVKPLSFFFNIIYCSFLMTKLIFIVSSQSYTQLLLGSVMDEVRMIEFYLAK